MGRKGILATRLSWVLLMIDDHELDLLGTWKSHVTPAGPDTEEQSRFQGERQQLLNSIVYNWLLITGASLLLHILCWFSQLIPVFSFCCVKKSFQVPLRFDLFAGFKIKSVKHCKCDWSVWATTYLAGSDFSNRSLRPRLYITMENIKAPLKWHQNVWCPTPDHYCTDSKWLHQNKATIFFSFFGSMI